MKLCSNQQPATSNQQLSYNWTTFLQVFFLLLITSLTLVSCEKDPIIDESNNSHIENGNGMFKTMQVNDLPQLKEELNHLTERSIAKNETSFNEVNFELFETYDVKVATIDNTTTYTLPVVQARENNRQFSNLVLTYTNDVLTDSFILKYEGTIEYFNQYFLNSETPFSGTVSFQNVIGNADLFAKAATCETVTINFCTNDGEGGIGDTHVAGENCKNESLMYSISKKICKEPAHLAADGPGSGSGFGGQDTGGGGSSGGNPIEPGNNTRPVPNPCPKSSTGLDDGNGGCYDPSDDNPILHISIIIGSADNNPGGRPYVPNNDDVFVLPDIPRTMSKQRGATCVSSSIEYVANSLGGDITQKEIEDWFYDNFKIIIFLDGVSFNKVSILVNQFLTTGPFIGIKESIDAGNPYITNIELSRTVNADGSIAIDGHMVTIVGYHPNGDYIFMDPLAGALREAPPSSFPNDFSFGGTITGVR
jgi:hypothetical protein